MPGTKAETLAERFFKKIDKTTSCWLWKGAKSGGSPLWYGKIAYLKTFISAHRASWLIHFGHIPEGKIIMHECDTPLCVNPSHLRIGTQRENIKQMYARGRWRRK